MVSLSRYSWRSMIVLRRLMFGSCYAYTNAGRSRVARHARAFCARVKAGHAEAIARGAQRVHQLIGDRSPIASILVPGATLVPTPGSAPRDADHPWVSEHIAQALRAVGVGVAVAHLLRRQQAVAKSAFALPGERPSVDQHYLTMRVTRVMPPTTTLVLIDDVVTRGRTLLAAASRLAEAYPDATIQAFALIRYRGLVDDLERRDDPGIGFIRWDGMDAQRDP